MSEDTPDTRRERAYKILSASLFTAVSVLLLGAAIYWSVSKTSACSIGLIFGYVSIEVTPPEALVVIDKDTLKGPQLKDIKRPVGRYGVLITASGYKSRQDSILVAEGSKSISYRRLEEIPIAQLSIKSNPPNASVYIDDELIGNTGQQGSLNRDVEPGVHKIKVASEAKYLEKRIPFVAKKEHSLVVDLTKFVQLSVKARDVQSANVKADMYAEIFVDGKPLLDQFLNTPVKTPRKIRVSLGNHTITVHKNGYEQIEPREANYEKDATITFRLRKKSGV